jgi:nucleoside-diphosphate-sugar epimerase
MGGKYLFCFGLGYVATALSKELGDEWIISGTHTDERRIRNGESIFNDHTLFNQGILQEVTHILISIPPSENGDLTYLRYLRDIKQLKKLEWIGYFSSTSVYGNHKGAWVNEKSITDPFDHFGKNRLIAENQWLSSDLPVNIIRLAAIYGPGRSTLDMVKLNKASRIDKKNHYFSRIYIKDLISLLIQVINRPKLGEIFNFADDCPSPQHEVVSFACNLLNVEQPKLIKFEQAELSAAMRLYYSSSKRVDNTKIKDMYDLDLNFPSYKEGLIDILQNEEKLVEKL